MSSVKGPWLLYFITDARRRYVKIGLTRNVEQRLHALQAGSPLALREELVLLHCGRAEEERLHQAFARHWRHREWFTYAPEIKERVAATHASGAWTWEGIPPARTRYDGSFGGQLSHYEYLARARAGMVECR